MQYDMEQNMQDGDAAKYQLGEISWEAFEEIIQDGPWKAKEPCGKNFSHRKALSISYP